MLRLQALSVSLRWYVNVSNTVFRLHCFNSSQCIYKIDYTTKIISFIVNKSLFPTLYAHELGNNGGYPMTGFSISMDLAPKPLQSQDASILKSTAESRLKNFMQDVTGRALVMMESATQGQHGIAMDLVQEAFISLHKSYAEKSTEEWYPLFYTILNNKLQDWRRKEARRNQPFSFFKKSASMMTKLNLTIW